MGKEVTYTIVMNVSNCWERLKATSGFEDHCGELIFTKLFDLAPEVKHVYGVASDVDFWKSPTYIMHARAMVDMIDCAISFLGPDLDPLSDHLKDLGKRHVAYGVEPEFLPMMSRAVIFALSEMMGDDFSMEVYMSWVAVLQLIVSRMLQGMRS